MPAVDRQIHYVWRIPEGGAYGNPEWQKALPELRHLDGRPITSLDAVRYLRARLLSTASMIPEMAKCIIIISPETQSLENGDCELLLAGPTYVGLYHISDLN